MNIEQRLFAEGCAFDFFQAVRILARLDPSRRPVGQAGPPRDEVVRFRALTSLNFPQSMRPLLSVSSVRVSLTVRTKQRTDFGAADLCSPGDPGDIDAL